MRLEHGLGCGVMGKARIWVSIIMTFMLFGMVSCAKPVENKIARGEAQGATPSGFAALPAPEECPNVVDLQAAIEGTEFPLAVPAHPLASPQNVEEICLEPSGRVIMTFPSPRPADQPLWFDGLMILQGPWDGEDEPLAVYERRIDAYPEDTGKAIYTVKGVPALADLAHDSSDGTDAAYLTLVLGRGGGIQLAASKGVDVELTGGESVEDLIAIAETLQLITP